MPQEGYDRTNNVSIESNNKFKNIVKINLPNIHIII